MSPGDRDFIVCILTLAGFTATWIGVAVVYSCSIPLLLVYCPSVVYPLWKGGMSIGGIVMIAVPCAITMIMNRTMARFVDWVSPPIKRD